MLRIEELKVGDWVVNKESREEYEILGVNLYHQRLWLGGGEFILSKNFKYFEKKEEHTFNDLIGVAVQANKDRVINGFSVVGEVLNCQTLDGEDYNLGIGCEVAHGIKYLQSLYKETFVIESEKDVERIKDNAVVTLLNGHELPAIKARRDEYIEFTGVGDFYFLVLKGATVEQDRNV